MDGSCSSLSSLLPEEARRNEDEGRAGQSVEVGQGREGEEMCNDGWESEGQMLVAAREESPVEVGVECSVEAHGEQAGGKDWPTKVVACDVEVHGEQAGGKDWPTKVAVRILEIHEEQSGGKDQLLKVSECDLEVHGEHAKPLEPPKCDVEIHVGQADVKLTKYTAVTYGELTVRNKMDESGHKSSGTQASGKHWPHDMKECDARVFREQAAGGKIVEREMEQEGALEMAKGGAKNAGEQEAAWAPEAENAGLVEERKMKMKSKIEKSMAESELKQPGLEGKEDEKLMMSNREKEEEDRTHGVKVENVGTGESVEGKKAGNGESEEEEKAGTGESEKEEEKAGNGESEEEEEKAGNGESDMEKKAVKGESEEKEKAGNDENEEEEEEKAGNGENEEEEEEENAGTSESEKEEKARTSDSEEEEWVLVEPDDTEATRLDQSTSKLEALVPKRENKTAGLEENPGTVVENKEVNDPHLGGKVGRKTIEFEERSSSNAETVRMAWDKQARMWMTTYMEGMGQVQEATGQGWRMDKQGIKINSLIGKADDPPEVWRPEVSGKPVLQIISSSLGKRRFLLFLMKPFWLDFNP
jgi:hypothetical protein